MENINIVNINSSFGELRKRSFRTVKAQMPNRGKRSDGFTLIELLVTIVIVAIFSTFAFSSFRYVVISNRISKNMAELRSSIEIARSTAMKTGLPTAICPLNSVDGTCKETEAWSTGWLIGSTTGCGSEGRPAVQKVNLPAQNIQVTFESPNNYLCFNRLGLSSENTGIFKFDIVEGSTTYKRCLVVNSVGGMETLSVDQVDSTGTLTCS